MQRSIRLSVCCSAIVCASAGSPLFADGVHVGRSDAGDLLTEIEPQFTHLILLDPIAPGGLFNGFSGADPGVTNLLDEIGEMLPLESGAEVWLEAVSIDPALLVVGTDFNLLRTPGDRSLLGDGSAIFDTHPTYIIDSDDLMFDSNGCVWQAMLRIVDLGATAYAPSDPFVLRFTTIAPLSATGDFNQDNQLTDSDVEALAACANGPNTIAGTPGTPACEPRCLNAFDFDADQDADLSDYVAYQIIAGGP